MTMKKTAIMAMCAVLTVTGCNTYTGMGAYTGSSLGSILGSAIGGISGGPRGSDVGTIVGMATGAIIGGAIGNQADQQQKDQRQADLDQYRRDKANRAARRNGQATQQGNLYNQQDNSNGLSGYYGNNGNNGQPDDRITFDEGDGTYGSGNDNISNNNIDSKGSGSPTGPGNGYGATDTKDREENVYDFHSSDYTGNYTAQQPTTTMPGTSSVEELTEGMAYIPHIEIRNARIVDDNQDKVISRGELCKVIFEVYNTGERPLYDIQPSVVEATGNKQIFISPGMHVERLMPGAGIRYTAMLKAGPRLGDGTVRICLSVLQGDNAISKVTEFEVPTSKKKTGSK